MRGSQCSTGFRMPAKNRRAYMSRYHTRYKPHQNARKGECIYCGLAADTSDHVPPVSVVYALGADHFEEAGIDLVLVPACRECNSLLGARMLPTLRERASFIADALRKRYAKQLAAPSWDSEEMEELGRNLGNMVSMQEAVKRMAKRRIAIAEYAAECY
jgi:5-methylcytosine-specific restriction endonuclease McrA